MTKKQKKDRIKSLVNCQFKVAIKQLKENVDIALSSGAIDIDNWSEESNKMLIPNAIVTAVLEEASTSFNGVGTCFEKKIKKDVKNIRYFL